MVHIKPNAGRHFIVAFVLILSVIFADQYSKWMVMENLLGAQEQAPAFADWFQTKAPHDTLGEQGRKFGTMTLHPNVNLVMVWNQGVSFGLFDSDSPAMSIVFIGVSLTICMFLLIWLALTSHKLVAFALSLVIGGAVGNIIDRLRFGAVADFIDVHVRDIHWPAFNVADSCIVAGAALLMLDAVFRPGNKHATVDIDT